MPDYICQIILFISKEPTNFQTASRQYIQSRSPRTLMQRRSTDYSVLTSILMELSIFRKKQSMKKQLWQLFDNHASSF